MKLNRSCASCSSSSSIVAVSNDWADWLKELKRDPLPIHTRSYLTLEKLKFPNTFPIDSDLSMRAKIDRKVGKKLLYWAANSSRIGDSLKTAEHAYGEYTNIGVCEKDKDGFFNFILRCPQAYITNRTLWERHIHFVDLDSSFKEIMTIACYPQKNESIVTKSIHTDNQSMYLDFDGFVRAKMLKIKRICAIPKEYKIFDDDYVVLHDDKNLNLNKFNKTEPLVIYCANEDCGAAKSLISRMNLLGYTNIFYFSKGYDGAFENKK